MQHVRTSIYFFLIIPLIFILLFTSYGLVTDPTSWNFSTIANSLSPALLLATVLLVWVSYDSFILNQQRSVSEDYLTNAIDLLSKAYAILISAKDSCDHPLKSRAGWLSAARMIKSSENISGLITEQSHILIWEEHREYWRIQFSDLLRLENYYAEHPVDMINFSGKGRWPLSESSIAIIYRFSRWNPDRANVIEKESKFTDEEIKNMYVEDIPLYKLLNEKKRIQSEMDRGDKSAL